MCNVIDQKFKSGILSGEVETVLHKMCEEKFGVPSFSPIQYTGLSIRDWANYTEAIVYYTDSQTGEEYHFGPCLSKREALREAIQAFRTRRKEREYSKKREAAEAFLNAHPDQVWVSLRDSIDAGNCSPYSQEFKSAIAQLLNADGEIGAVRASFLLKHVDLALGKSYLKRACVYAALRGV
jgi:hypothetical protein